MGDGSAMEGVAKYSMGRTGDELRTILLGCSNEQVDRMLSRLGPDEWTRLLLRLGPASEAEARVRERVKALETALKLAVDWLDELRTGGLPALWATKNLDTVTACRAVLDGRFEKHPLVGHWEDIANFGRDIDRFETLALTIGELKNSLDRLHRHLSKVVAP